MVDKQKDRVNCATCYSVRRPVKWKAVRRTNGVLKIKYLCDKCKRVLERDQKVRSTGWVIGKL